MNYIYLVTNKEMVSSILDKQLMMLKHGGETTFIIASILLIIIIFIELFVNMEKSLLKFLLLKKLKIIICWMKERYFIFLFTILFSKWI